MINSADLATFQPSLRTLFEEFLMRVSINCHDTRDWFMSEPDSIEVDPLVCRKCASVLTLHQPDSDMPDRILGTCGGCKTWYLFNGDLDDVEIAPVRTH
jgi:hypothetical protein